LKEILNDSAIIYCGDNIEVLKKCPDNYFDSVVTDPPYGLKFMGKKWDYDVPSVEQWEEILRVLKPGGHLLSFGGTRTYHRLVVNIEDAGFEIRDQIQWIYGQGFPKSHDISKAIDKLPKANDRILEFSELIKSKRIDLKISLSDADKKITNGSTMYSFIEGRNLNGRFTIYPPNEEYYQKICELYDICGWEDIIENNLEIVSIENGDFGYQKNNERWDKDRKIYKTTSDESIQWDGWGTQLKPANEPICLARKPISEKTIAENVLKWGVGGINIDDCRIELNGEIVPINKLENWSGFGEEKKPDYEATKNTKGRFPANVIFDEEAGRMLDEQSGISTSSGGQSSLGAFRNGDIFGKGKDIREKINPGLGDSGGASRFFYCAKVSKKERGQGNDHPTVKPQSLMEHLVKLVTPKGGIVLDPFMGSGSTGLATEKLGFQFRGIDLEEKYFFIAKERLGF